MQLADNFQCVADRVILLQDIQHASPRLCACRGSPKRVVVPKDEHTPFGAAERDNSSIFVLDEARPITTANYGQDDDLVLLALESINSSDNVGPALMSLFLLEVCCVRQDPLDELYLAVIKAEDGNVGRLEAVLYKVLGKACDHLGLLQVVVGHVF